METVLCRVQGLTLSTSFSGIGAAEVALGTIARGLVSASGTEVIWSNLFAVEINKECQMELQCLSGRPGCIYGDIVEFIAPAIREHMRENRHRLRFEDLVRLAKQPGFTVPRATCIVHGSGCTANTALLHVAGTPRVDYSRVGKRNGLLGGGLLPFLAWIGQRRCLQETAVLHENVSQFVRPGDVGPLSR